MLRFALLAVLSVLNYHGGECSPFLGRSTDHFDYDYLMFSQAWPPTACLHENKKWSEARALYSYCEFPDFNDSWSIHGLWPSSRNRNKKIAHCTKKVRYTEHSVKPDVRKELTSKWYTSNLRISNDRFWKHEFETHGTCTYDIGIGKNVNDYFRTSMRLLDKYNVGDILDQALMKPGRAYSFGRLVEAIEKDLGVHVKIKCTGIEETSEQYLHEVRICFDRFFGLINCNERETTTNCDRKRPVIYIPKYDLLRRI